MQINNRDNALSHAGAQHNGPARPSSRYQWPEFVAADDLCASCPPPPEELIAGVLYRSGTMLLSGPPKSHKSFTLLNLAESVATGLPWLNFETRQTRVLYINLELQDFSIARRTRLIAEALDIAPSGNLIFWNLRCCDVTLHTLEQRLPGVINRTGAGLVIIDPHYKIACNSGAEENSNDAQGRLLSALQNLCEQNGAALVIAHHFAKGDAAAKNAIDRASGGGVFARWGDAFVTFTDHKEEDAMTVEMSLRDFAPVEPFVVRWEFPVWRPCDNLNPSSLRRSFAKQQFFVEDALAALSPEGMSLKNWAAAAKMSPSTLARLRDELVACGKIRLECGLYKK